MEPATTVDNPAAGPETLSLDPLMKVTIIPPMTPDIIPAYKGAPDAKAMPKQSGKATKNTDIPAGRSCFNQTNR